MSTDVLKLHVSQPLLKMIVAVYIKCACYLNDNNITEGMVIYWCCYTAHRKMTSLSGYKVFHPDNQVFSCVLVLLGIPDVFLSTSLSKSIRARHILNRVLTRFIKN